MTKRYQDEIEEILKKAGDLPDAPTSPDNAPNQNPPPPHQRLRQAAANLRQGPITYKHALISGLAILLTSIFWGGLPMLLTGAALIITGYILYYRAPRRPPTSNQRPPTKTWRGRPLNPDDDDPHFTQDRWGTGRRR